MSRLEEHEVEALIKLLERIAKMSDIADKVDQILAAVSTPPVIPAPVVDFTPVIKAITDGNTAVLAAIAAVAADLVPTPAPAPTPAPTA